LRLHEIGKYVERSRRDNGTVVGTTAGLAVMKGVEYGETHYEIEGKKNGKKVEVTYDASGKQSK